VSDQLQHQEHALVATTRGLLAQRLEDPAIAAGLEVALAARGRIIASAEDAAIVAGLAGKIAVALKAVKRAKDDVGEIPRAMVAAINAAAKLKADALEAGKKSLADATIAWTRQENERISVAHRENVRRANLEAARAREAAAAAGTPEEDVPPPLEAPAPPPAPTAIAGGSTQQVITEILKCELIDPLACDVSWLRLDEAAAKERFRGEMQRGESERPGDRLHPIDYRGVRFWFEQSVSTRSR